MACKGIVRVVHGPDGKYISAKLQCEGKCGNEECPEPQPEPEDTPGGGRTLHYKCKCNGDVDGGSGNCGTELIIRDKPDHTQTVEIFCPHVCRPHQVEPHCRPVLVRTVFELVGLNGGKDESLYDVKDPKHNTVRYYRCGCPVLIRDWF